MNRPALVLQILILLLVKSEGSSTPKQVSINSTSLIPTSSPWLERVMNQRQTGCITRPWICGGREFPPRSLCCRNRCVDLRSDRNNCGLCGIRCVFNWQCCRGICTDTKRNPFNCGRCGNVCPNGSFCFYGMCGYAAWPLPPPRPRPPKVKIPYPPHKHHQHPREL
ncbi:hypothetical protein L6164_031095 [Bauhinia variegata]|uniref:Uncharacterized protein n=1 Tax=Bauhinia variegata TaxID=167791 RepID=A0ACB9LF90_BAUVA|nr:hypothetical protein L6164_031095 [Bauhinia variegata]